MAKSRKKSVKQEEYVTHKILTVFSICLFGVLLLMALQRLLSYGSTFMLGMVVQKVLLVIGIIGAAWGVYLLVQEHTRRRSIENRIICGRHVLLVCGIFIVIMAAIGYFGTAPIHTSYVLLPALAVYYLIYHSYAPEFFIISLDCGIALALIWVIRRAQISSHFGYMQYLAVVSMVVLTLVQVMVTAQTRKGNGTFTFAGRKIELQLSKNAYTMLYTTPIVLAVVLAAALVPTLQLVCMGIVAAYLFITAVYYTVKLM